VADIGGHVDAVEHQVRHAQHVRQVFLLDAGKAVLDGALIRLVLGLLAQVLDGAHEEAAGAAGGVEHGLTEAGIHLLDDELGDGARGVELAGVASRLEILEKLLVDVAEHVAIVGRVEVDAVDLVDDLPHQRAVLHVVVGVLEGRPDEAGDAVATAGESLQPRQQEVVDEVEQGIARDTLFVRGPGGPTQRLGQGGPVVVAQQFEFLLPVIEDLQEEHPAELLKTLRVAVSAGVLAHDVLDGFDEVGNVGHEANRVDGR